MFQSSQVLQIRLGFIKRWKKGGNRDVIERDDTHKGDKEKEERFELAVVLKLLLVSLESELTDFLVSL